MTNPPTQPLDDGDDKKKLRHNLWRASGFCVEVLRGLRHDHISQLIESLWEKERKTIIIIFVYGLVFGMKLIISWKKIFDDNDGGDDDDDDGDDDDGDDNDDDDE